MVVKILAIALAICLVKIADADDSSILALGACPEPTHPDHGKALIEKGVITKGMAVKYRCDEKYSLMGSGTRHCQETGIWSGEQPTCEFLCSFPPLIKPDGLTSEINPGRKDPLRDSAGNVVLQEIAYLCSEGYTISGTPLLRCLGEGKWDNQPPTCERSGSAMCVDFGIVENGVAIVGRSATYPVGTVATFHCNAGYRMKGPSIIVCSDSGQWSSAPAECIAKQTVTETVSESSARGSPTITTGRSTPPRLGGCPKPLDTPHGKYAEVTQPVGASRVPAEGPFPVNTVIHFACEHYYVLGNAGTNRRTTRTCFRSGEWSGRDPYCLAVCGRSEQPLNPQVVGGWAASPNEFPWQAALTFRATTSDPAYRKIICGAVLVSEIWAMTAAHCVHVGRTKEKRDESEFLVLFGKHFYNRNLDDNDVDARRVIQIIVHDNYDPGSLDYDIALILLKDPVNFNAKILPVCLPSPSSTLDVGTNGTVSGWGYIDQNETSPKQLMTSQLPVVDSAKCERNYNIKVTDRMFCAGFEQGGTNTCEGDSGGPFVVWDNDRYVLQGLVSWGNAKNCAGAGFYGAFVRVNEFVQWIRDWGVINP